MKFMRLLIISTCLALFSAQATAQDNNSGIISYFYSGIDKVKKTFQKASNRLLAGAAVVVTSTIIFRKNIARVINWKQRTQAQQVCIELSVLGSILYTCYKYIDYLVLEEYARRCEGDEEYEKLKLISKENLQKLVNYLKEQSANGDKKADIALDKIKDFIEEMRIGSDLYKRRNKFWEEMKLYLNSNQNDLIKDLVFADYTKTIKF